MKRRAAAIYMLLVVLFTGMISRFYQLSAGDQLASVANGQSTFVLEADRTRGMIYDRNMKPMVATRTRQVAAVQPSPEAAKALAQARYEHGETAQYDPEATRPYLLSLSEGEIYARGIEMFDTIQRYGDEQPAAHLIGYLNPDKTAGAAGVELAYDALLQQYAGTIKLRYTTDAFGQTRQTIPPEIVQDNYKSPGGLSLTLDKQIQVAVEEAMQDVKRGAAVVMDVNTGDVLASVSVPAFNPNDLSKSLKNPDSPFVNRVFSAYNVGSTFKLVVAAAALDNGFGQYAPLTCQGYTEVGDLTFHCHWRNGHGSIDLKKAILVSCNPFFIELGHAVGGKKIVSLARELGFGRAAQFSEDLRSTAGTLPNDQQLANIAEVANLSFGQGVLTATPLQVTQMLCAVANGGNAVTPRLVQGYTDNGQAIYEYAPAYALNRAFSERTAEVLQACLVANVEEGSGVLAKPARGGAGGKTASAQTGIYLEPGVEDSEVVHAWFAGFYPAQKPAYAITVLVEDGKSGSDVAAPIFKKIADALYFLS